MSDPNINTTTSTSSCTDSLGSSKKNPTTITGNSRHPSQLSPSFADIPAMDQHHRLHSPYDDGEPDTSYEIFSDGEYNPNNSSSRPIRSLRSIRSAKSQQRESSARFSRTFSEGRNYYERRGDRLHQYYNERANRIFSESPQPASNVPLMEVSAEIYAVRKSALSVYEPLTYTWVSTAVVVAVAAAGDIMRKL
jgi:hypothetical protein